MWLISPLNHHKPLKNGIENETKFSIEYCFIQSTSKKGKLEIISQQKKISYKTKKLQWKFQWSFFLHFLKMSPVKINNTINIWISHLIPALTNNGRSLYKPDIFFLSYFCKFTVALRAWHLSKYITFFRSFIFSNYDNWYFHFES